MGIYIKNMEMPGKGYRLILIHADGTVQTTDGEKTAVSVPEPHGRLIDMNKMLVEFIVKGQRNKRYKLGEKWELNFEEIRSVISRLPTIIPASEEE